jgi:hypothetical protein
LTLENQPVPIFSSIFSSDGAVQGDSCATAESSSDIHGKLTKMENGKKIALKNVELIHDCGCD